MVNIYRVVICSLCLFIFSLKISQSIWWNKTCFSDLIICWSLGEKKSWNSARVQAPLSWWNLHWRTQGYHHPVVKSSVDPKKEKGIRWRTWVQLFSMIWLMFKRYKCTMAIIQRNQPHFGDCIQIVICWLALKCSRKNFFQTLNGDIYLKPHQFVIIFSDFDTKTLPAG